ncbi:ABC transporter permease [Sphingomicrobium lutaoense]|uniref:Putative ABC transport system permease protein n=1 Tax=Sphingomicrobium lutaoense TaxID=515949 RepID=A0A839Z4H0_9SPHN|nr:ABC transporter permease [Sphingomicrobium lutaoense]MBB3764997.1 putative ABC transport system permease protein [Sphingomicrobium lutaoense]
MTVWKLAKCDLRGGLGGLGLLWLCLTLAVAGLAAVLSLVSAMDRAIEDNARALLGGDLELSIAAREAGPDELAAIRALGPVTHVIETRAMLNAGKKGTSLVELKGVDEAYPLAGTLELDGRRPRGQEIAVDRDLAARLSLEVGDRVKLGLGEFTISALILDMANGGGFFFAPPVLIDPDGLAASRLVRPGSIVEHEYRILLAAEADPEAVGQRFTERFEDAGWDFTTRDGAAGGTQRFVSRTGDLLLLVALSALGIGSLGIASAASAFAATRRRTVAQLKLVGGTRRAIGAMLSIELGIVVVAALLVGLALGALAPPIVGSIIGERLPIAPHPGPHLDALSLAAITGILVTVAAAWSPLAGALDVRPAALLRGSVEDGAGERRWLVPLIAGAAAIGVALFASSNRELAALAIGGLFLLALIFGAMGWAIRLLARRLRHRGGPVQRLGVAALDRPGNATVRLTVALGLGLSLLLLIAATGQSLLNQIDENIAETAPDYFLIDLPRESEADYRALVDRVLPGAGVAIVPSLRGAVTAVKGQAVAEMEEIPDGAWILRGDRGLTFLSELPASNRITRGQWWSRDYDGPPLLSIDADAAEALDLAIGDTMTVSILGRPLTAEIASFREIDWRSYGFNFALIFSPGSLDDAPYTLMSTVSAPPGTDLVAFEREVVEAFPQVSAIKVADIVSEFRAILLSLDAAVRIAIALAIAMGVIVLAGSVVATRAQRARDIVLLRLVGGQRRQLIGTQLVEFSILAALSALGAAGAGLLAAWLLCAYWFEIAFAPQWESILAIPAGAILLAIVAALLAAWPALAARPAEALRAR